MKTPKKSKPDDAVKKDLATQIAKARALVRKSMAIIKQTGIENNPLQHFWLSPAQRDVLLAAPGVSQSLKEKLAQPKASFTHADVAGMALALLKSVPSDDPWQQATSLLFAKNLLERLNEDTVALVTKAAAKTKAKAKALKTKAPKTRTPDTRIFQFKITLLGIEPPIWRRIQTKDCTLDTLHEHIQTAMGWTNSHLHQFIINGTIYGDPELLDDGWEETPPVNSRRTKLSKLIPKDGKRFRFQYEYDFGDAWEHEVLFEGFPPGEKGVRYPVCVEGEGACPPEDIGGTGGYEEYVRAMANPKHKRHKEFMKWRGPFDSEKFDAEAATKEMRKGLPDWRNEEWI